MHRQKYRQFANRRQLTSLVGAAICLAASAPAFAQAQTGTSAGVPAETLAETPEAAAGMVVYVDPQTGRVLPQPAPGTQPFRLTPIERNALSTSDAGLVVVPSPVPGGGEGVDLQGRFQSPFFAAVGDDGAASVLHLEELPSAGHKP